MHYDAGGTAVSPLHEVAPLDERCRTSPVGHARILLTFAPLKISRCFHTEQEAGAWACRRGSASGHVPTWADSVPGLLGIDAARGSWFDSLEDGTGCNPCLKHREKKPGVELVRMSVG